MLGRDAIPAAWIDDLLERALVETVATDFFEHFYGENGDEDDAGRRDLERYPGW